MKICGIYYLRDEEGNPFHPAHQPWIESIKKIKVKSCLPPFFSSTFWTKGVVGQIFSFIQSFNIPRADIYLIESISCMPCVIFKPGKKIIINTDTFFYDFPNFSYLKRKYAEWLLKNVDGIISTSSMMKDYAEKYTKKPNEVIIPFVNARKFLSAKSVLKNGSTHSLICMNRSYSKGTDIIIDVFKKYRKSHNNARMYVCGSGTYKVPKLDGIVDLGFCKNPAKWMEKASFYLNTARHEPFGVTIIEAMAAGLIPIVSKHCGAKMFVEKIDKRLITDLNPDNIIKTMLYFEKRKDLNSIRERCRELAKTFTKEKTVHEFQTKFSRLVNKK